MTLTSRDKKILLVVAVVGALAAYWFLLLSPKREEVTTLEERVSEQQDKLAAAEALAAQAERAKASFASDYATVVRLGKAIPTSVDMPSLLVQLDRAARGTDIRFDKIAAGERVAATTPAASQPAPDGQDGAAAPGGEPAGSAPGQAAESAGESAEAANAESEQRESASGEQPGDPGGSAQQAPAVPGLDTVPLDFEFRGDFFDLADFFHRLKRFVRVASESRVVVRGRLMTIDEMKIKVDEGRLTATVKATVYLAPETQGATAGATPQGPVPQPASGAPQQASAAPTPPTAASVP